MLGPSWMTLVVCPFGTDERRVGEEGPELGGLRTSIPANAIILSRCEVSTLRRVTLSVMPRSLTVRLFLISPAYAGFSVLSTSKAAVLQVLQRLVGSFSRLSARSVL